MVHPLRIEYPEQYIISLHRGILKNIFLSEKDRKSFLTILSDAIEKYNWLCHVFYIMNNHCNLLIETLESNLSMVMRQGDETN